VVIGSGECLTDQATALIAKDSPMISYLTILIQAQKAKMDERGASAVEYGLLVAGIAAIVVVAVMALGPVVKDAFGDTCTAIQTKDTNATTASTCAP
jgi:pilus assembly protein Flp/PilA